MTLYAVQQQPYEGGSAVDHGRLAVDVVMYCVGHADDIVHVEWAFQTNHIFVQCADRMMYIWSLTTGVLERIVPQVMVHQHRPSLNQPPSHHQHHHHQHHQQSPWHLSIASSHELTRLTNIHVFPCDMEGFCAGQKDGQVMHDHAKALLAFLLTWHDDGQTDQLVRDTLGMAWDGYSIV